MYACEVYSDWTEEYEVIGVTDPATAQAWMIQCRRDGLNARIVYVA